MMREEAAQSLYGEYNDQQLGINLDPLDETYLVQITDESGKAVYEKAVNAGSIVGLNIDISDYAEGRYTVTVENSNESFTAQFDTQRTSFVEVRSKRLEVKDAIYNLQGQRLSSLRKGLNIVNGRKVFVK
jgi:flagellar hook assembly protein FlgD